MGIYVPQRHKICKKEAVLGYPWSPAARGRGRCGRLGERRSCTGGLAPRESGRASRPADRRRSGGRSPPGRPGDHGASEEAGVAEERSRETMPRSSSSRARAMSDRVRLWQSRVIGVMPKIS